jgi:sporulation protein YlmC with PRC-barrel domain
MRNSRDNRRDERVSLGDTDDMRGASAGALGHLSELDHFEIADGEPDIRGWEVKASDGRKVGEVADLIVDTGAMKVRYIELKLDEEVAEEASRPGDDLNPRSEPLRHVLVPIGAARLDDDDEVRLSRRATEIAGIPAYERGGMSRDYEREVLRRCAAGGQVDRSHDERDFYSSSWFDDSSFFGSRRRGRERTSFLRQSDQRSGGGSRGGKGREAEVRMTPVAEVEVIAVEVGPAGGGAAGGGGNASSKRSRHSAQDPS